MLIQFLKKAIFFKNWPRKNSEYLCGKQLFGPPKSHVQKALTAQLQDSG